MATKTDPPLVNRVAQSGLIVLDPGVFFPTREIRFFDLKEMLVKGLVLMEKPYRQALKSHDWEQYRDQFVAIGCSADALVPMWAWMLLTSYLQPVAGRVFQGTAADFRQALMLETIREKIDPETYRDQRVLIKGCGDHPIGAAAYVEITRLLQPVVQSLMFGEPCSTVPVFKKLKPAGQG